MIIHVSLRFFASLTRRTPDNSERFPVSAGSTIGELLAVLGVSEEEAKLVFINHKRVELNTILNDGDRVGVFPPVGGG